jgi:hypothetical protein
MPPNSAVGCRWHAVAAPRHAYAKSRFDGVTALSAARAWAVGSTYTGHENSPDAPVVARWDGVHWATAAEGLPRSATVLDVDAAPGAVWLAGFSRNHAFVARLDGSRWTTMRPPVNARFSHLNGIDVIAADDVWAVGGISTGGSGRTLALHWDGSHWRAVRTPSPRPSPATGSPYTDLSDVDALRPDDVWAVGQAGNVAPVGQTETIAVHWDGHRWRHVPTANRPTSDGRRFNILFGVAAVSSDDVWAVGDWNGRWPGFGGGGDHALLEHWDGHRWGLVDSGVGGRSILYGVTGLGTGVLAVGDRGIPWRTLALRGAASWHAASPTPGSLADVATAPDGTRWVAGQREGQAMSAVCLPATP